MSKVSGSFEVNASNWAEVEFDTDGLSPDEIVQKLYEEHPGISVCHQCANDIEDPELGDVVGFTVDGVEYIRLDGEWVCSG